MILIDMSRTSGEKHVFCLLHSVYIMISVRQNQIRIRLIPFISLFCELLCLIGYFGGVSEN